ncbi:MAG: ribonuclease HII [Paramuribaculum sp.]|nr:ribonuclease HII [Paramuribaculum sp.]
MTKLHSPLPDCFDTTIIEAGCDEAGRGCLAGPVFAAAVILPHGFTHKWLNDSKQISESRRNELRRIIESEAVAWAVGIVDNTEIDRINILNASILAMHRALDALNTPPQAIIVDGNRFKPYKDIPYTTFVKGDGRFGNIAAASILAKTHRDEYMVNAHAQYPHYGWDVNKGYPTRAHRTGIEIHGPSPLHRMSFRLIDTQLTLF